MRFLLIPVTPDLHAVDHHLSELDDARPLTPEEITQVSRLLLALAASGEALLEYAGWLMGKPSKN